MLPPFEVQGGVMLVAVRAGAVAGLLWVFGSLVFRLAVLPRVRDALTPQEAGRVACRQAVLTRAGVAVGGAGLLLWLVLQAGGIAEARSWPQWAAAVPAVAWHTQFGRLIVAQLVLMAGVAALLIGDGGRRERLAGAGALLALALQAGHGHAAAMPGGASLLMGAGVLHLLGAGAWLGGLLPLLLVVRDAPARAGAIAARWFSPMGKLSVLALAASATVQGWALVGSLAGFVGTAYGWVLLVKLALFGALLGFAVANRYRLAPGLLRGEPGRAKVALVRSIAVQSGVGLAVVAAAAVLSQLPPSMHVQAVWPFAQRLSLAAVREDADYRREAIGAAIALGAALALAVAAGGLRRRARWAAVAGAVVVGGAALPHFGPLFVPACPTSFYRSPTGFAASSIVDGAMLYPGHCAACHGALGRGDGPAGGALALPPADLTAAHLWMHEDGQLFWWLSHGMFAPDGQRVMPGFGGTLDEDGIWALIDFIRARNAGLGFAAGDGWKAPIRAPDVQALCAGDAGVTLRALRGRFVRVVVGAAVPARQADVVTLVLGAPGVRPGAGVCVVDDTAAVAAYALIAGVAPARLAGAQFLIDGGGWLRAARIGGAGWDRPGALAAAIAALRARPLAPALDGMDMKM